MFVLTISVQRVRGSNQSNDTRNINVQDETNAEEVAKAFEEATEFFNDQKARYLKGSKK
jgi:hypothetical protein